MTIIGAAWLRRTVRQTLLGLLLVSPLASAWAEQSSRVVRDMQRVTLWQLIDVLGGSPSLAPSAVVAVLPVAFKLTTRHADVADYAADGVALADGVHLGDVALRTRLDDTTRGLMVLDVEGACMTLDDVRRRYPAITLTSPPPGHSPSESSGYSDAQAWGTLGFGFKESNRQCLATVVIDRT